jgi:colanic acid/amylovoran biosynthesis glycosyltransferase
MKIAYLINQYPKPSHTFIRREIQALERRGVDILRISLRGWNDVLADEQDKLERERTRYVLREGALGLLLAAIRVLGTRPVRFFRAIALATRLALNHSERPLAVHLIYVAEACQVLLWLRAAAVEHLHAHFGTNSAEVAMLTHVLGGPQWSMTVHGPAEFDRRPLLNLPEKIRRSAFAVAISSYGRSQLFRCVDHGYWSKIHVVHCGIDSSFYESTSAIESKGNRIICVGRLAEPKGQLLLIEAVRILRDRGVTFELVLAGDGEMRSDIEAMIARYELGEHVRLTGWISSAQIRDEILTSRGLVLASFAEGLPVVIMEAMALQRPVITTYVAGIPELVTPGEHGWLIPAGDIDALVNALSELLESPTNILQNMGQAAQARVICRHNIDVEAEKLRRLFKGAIEQHQLVR